MNFAPSPFPGSRIQELGDRLIVRFQPSRAGIVFLAVWLAGWTGGGIGALHALAGGGWGERAFLLLWLGGWAAGECAVICILAWKLAGREVLTVTAQRLEMRREIGRFSSMQPYDVALVGDVKAARVRADEDERPRTDFCLEFSYNGEEVRVGQGMDEREAEYIASTIRSWIYPPSQWWREAEHTDPYRGNDRVVAAAPAADAYALARAPAPRRRWVAVGASALVFVVAVGGAAALLLHDASRLRSVAATPAPTPTSSVPESVSNPREYAAATTISSLASAGVKVLGRPSCGKQVTWNRWACTMTARAATGPLAGRTLTYRCFAAAEQAADRSITCGPQQPPVTTVPSTREFSNPRAYAHAMTLYMLASAKGKTPGKPSCGKHVTRARWTCTVKAQATTGPFAGRTLTYRCEGTANEQAGGGQSTTCGFEPPLSAAAPGNSTVPTRQEYSNPREYASAMTVYSLTSGNNKVLGKPSCGRQATWTRWTCSMTARSTDGVLAGRILTYRCYADERAEPRTVECGPEHPASSAAAGSP